MLLVIRPSTDEERRKTGLKLSLSTTSILNVKLSVQMLTT